MLREITKVRQVGEKNTKRLMDAVCSVDSGNRLFPQQEEKAALKVNLGCSVEDWLLRAEPGGKKTS